MSFSYSSASACACFRAQADILCQHNLRLHPEFRLTLSVADMDMQARLFAGKEKEPKSMRAENRLPCTA